MKLSVFLASVIFASFKTQGSVVQACSDDPNTKFTVKKYGGGFIEDVGCWWLTEDGISQEQIDNRFNTWCLNDTTGVVPAGCPKTCGTCPEPPVGGGGGAGGGAGGGTGNTGAPPTGSGGGDLHFNLKGGELLTTQAKCGIVLSKASNFYGSQQPLAIHARTEVPNDDDNNNNQKVGEEYTFISNLAAQIDKNTYELVADGAKFYKNNELLDLNVDDEPMVETTSSGAKYTITKKIIGQRSNQVQYIFEFMDDKSQIIFRANLHFKMSFITMKGYFNGASLEGLLGNWKKDGLYDRKGNLMALSVKDVNVQKFVNEWQVHEDEPTLFLDHSYVPQKPNSSCIFVDDHEDVVNEEGSLPLQLRGSHINRGRRLSEEDVEKRLFAEKACKKHVRSNNEIKMQWCVEDVMRTGHAELAEDYLYE